MPLPRRFLLLCLLLQPGVARAAELDLAALMARLAAVPARASAMTSRAAGVSPCGRNSAMSVRTVTSDSTANNSSTAVPSAARTGKAFRARP